MMSPGILQLSRLRVHTLSPQWVPKLAAARRLGRSYTTHRDPVSTSPLLSQALDQKRQSSARDSVGPFQLGLTPPLRRDVEEKKWSQLSAGGKVVRMTSRTSNLAVILFGAGLSAILIYALTSELFSKNSPTVLYGEACEKIKQSPTVAKFLREPLVFHNNPPSLNRPRHRNHQVTSQVVVDSNGREHMLLNFYVKGSTSDATQESYADRIANWRDAVASSLPTLTLESCIQSITEHTNSVLEKSRHLFRFLSGESTPAPTAAPVLKQEVKEEKKEQSWTSGLTGLFSGLKSSTRGSSEDSIETFDGEIYEEGEVHADLVMNDQGLFEFRYLLIDIPNSHVQHPKRIFVERRIDVKDTERVQRWHQ